MKPRWLVPPAALSLTVLLGVSLAQDAKPKPIPGYYDLTSTEGASRGYLEVSASGGVRRVLRWKDGSLHSQHGRAKVEGRKLTVTFDGPGDPRDLSGPWSVTGRTQTTAYSGLARFVRDGARWSASLTCTFADAWVGTAPAELEGTLEDDTLEAQRSGAPFLSDEDHETGGQRETGRQKIDCPDCGTPIGADQDACSGCGAKRPAGAPGKAPKKASDLERWIVPENVTYTLSADGLRLHGTYEGTFHGWETFTRSTLPRKKGGVTATYTIDEAGALSGALATGGKDTGKRLADGGSAGTGAPPAGDSGSSVGPRPVTLEEAKLSRDPVPSSLRVAKAARFFRRPQALGSPVKVVEAKAGEPAFVNVNGRTSGFWHAPTTDGPRKTVLYVPEADLSADLRYKLLELPLFVQGGHPEASNLHQQEIATCYLDASLMACAASDPRLIESMVQDGKEAIAVRFWARDRDLRYRESWVKVKRSVLVDEKGGLRYTEGTRGTLWPAILEKAYAVWKGEGYYWNIEWGPPAGALEQILGRPSLIATCAIPVEPEATWVALPQADRAAVNAFKRSKAWKQEYDWLQQNPGARASIAYVDELSTKMKLSAEGKAKLHGYYSDFTEGPLGSGEYSDELRGTFAMIEARLKAKKPVVALTFGWGTGGTGKSGGENTDVVPGLASGHCYAVTGVSREDGLLWLTIVNPWQEYVRKYEKTAKGYRVSAVDELSRGSGGVMKLELSDLRRYFSLVTMPED